MRQLKLLNILTVRFGANGITVFVMNYYRHMDPAAVQADFIVPNAVPDRVRDEIAKNGGTVYVLPQRNRAPFSYMREVTRIVREGGYDIVHAHGNSATLYADLHAALSGGAPVRIAHSHNTNCRMKLADKLLRPFFYGCYTNAMACGTAAGEWLFPSRPFTVVQNAIDTELFCFSTEARARIRKALALPDDAFLLCHVGTFNAQKNHAFLVGVFDRIAAAAKNAHLLLIGDGPLRDAAELTVYRRRLASRVHSIGAIPSTAEYLSAADAFLLPSLHEGLPFTLIEAQCAGLPCLVSDTVTSDAFFTPLVETASLSDGPAKWAERLLPRLASPESDAVRAARSEEAAAAIRARGYDIEKNAAELVRLYQKWRFGDDA